MVDPRDFNLARLLQPISAAAFFSEYWEKHPLHISRNAPDYYASVLTLDQIDPLLTILPPDGVLLTDAAAETAIEIGDMIRADRTAATAALDVVKACQSFASGATIIIRDAHKRIASLMALTRTLESELGCPCKANLYMTPARGKGLDTHYDTHDTILLQIAGSKEWTIFDSPVQLPLDNQHADTQKPPAGKQTLSCTLSAGDLLYIPRGYLHHGRSCDDTSLHATVGVMSYRWADVLLEAVSDLCLNDPAFRRALPVDFGRGSLDMAATRKVFDDLLQRVRDNTQLEPALARLADQFVVGRSALVPGQIRQVMLARTLTLDDAVGVRPGLIYAMQRQGDMVRIRAHGRDIQLSADASEAVTFALETPAYRVRDLPGDLGDDGKLTIVRHLILEGLVLKLGAN
ncbi:MAG: cupin domain-containing protein [Pseudolabrys sp.]